MSRTWFDVTAAVGDHLVPERADWVVLHIRESVLAVVRQGDLTPFGELGITGASVGERLVIETLRHHDPDLEVTLLRVIEGLQPKVGDPYGAGRVTATGISRLASAVGPGHLRAIARSEAELRNLEQLNLGSAVVAPVTVGSVVIGALSVAHHRRGALDAADLTEAEQVGARVGAALDSTRAATARLAERHFSDELSWIPPDDGNPVGAARRWVRRVIPDLVRRRVREDLADDLDLIVSELAGNALRHAGSIAEIRLCTVDDAVRVAVVDNDDRRPVRRDPSARTSSGRGMVIVDALAARWDVEHRLPAGGKIVWADLPLF